MPLPSGGCPRFVLVSETKNASKKKTREKPATESEGIDIKLVSIREILSRDRHTTDDLIDSE
jgi:hypothetical protein